MTERKYGKIVVSPKHRERIRGNSERLFIALYNKYGWESVGSHPLEVFRSLRNPNGLNLETEIIKIDQYLISLIDDNPHKIWRSIDWIISFQSWLNRTKRSNLSIKDLKKPIKTSEIIKEEPSKYSTLGDKKTNGELKFDYYESLGNDNKGKEEINESYMEMLESLRSDFKPETVFQHRNYYYGYPGIGHDYMKELLELRIQKIIIDYDSETVADFMIWLSCRAEWIILHSFCDQIHDGKKPSKSLTEKPLIFYFPKEEEHEAREEEIITLDPNVIYSLSDLRRMPK